MKSSTPFQQLYLLAAVIFAITISCTKEKPELNPPVANAGEYILAFPTDTLLLDGRSSTDFGGQIIRYEWKKISGPTSYTIKNESSPIATIMNLQGGSYQFELTVTDNSNLKGKDTVTISVFEMGSGAREMNFTSLQWIDFWGYFLEIQNFHSFVPAATLFRVFVKSSYPAGWIEVIDNQLFQNQRYQYGISNSNLWIESFNMQAGTADVKIVF